MILVKVMQCYICNEDGATRSFVRSSRGARAALQVAMRTRTARNR